MKGTVRGPRSRWVGPPVSAPKSEFSRSPSGRQKHYGAVELAGAGHQVNVNDVVEVAENKQGQETSQRHPVLVQVLSLWEDTFTGVFKFRAHWLVQASDLPADALLRLRATRQTLAGDHSTAASKAPSNRDQDGADEVFLTKRGQDLEVRSIVKPSALCVSTSTAVPPESKGKVGPRLTHSFCEASGEFHRLENTDPILKRARVRQANAVALASRADQEHAAAKSGKPIVKSSGWLLPKRGAFERRDGRTVARGAGAGVEMVAPSTNSAESHLRSSSQTRGVKGASDDCEADEPPNSEHREWKEGEDKDATDEDSDSPTKSQPTPFIGEVFTQRKSARQRLSQRSPTPNAEVADCREAESEANARPPVFPTTLNFQRRRRAPSMSRQGALAPRPRRLAMPPSAEEPVAGADIRQASPDASRKSSVVVNVVRPVRTRMSLILRSTSSPALPRCSPMEVVGNSPPQLSISAKRKRSVANKPTQGANRSDYPPLSTLVGNDYQTDIPDLLTADEKKRPHTGTAAKLVWRSVQDWDSHSRGMLANFLHAAKGVVGAKQARPGVAVHVRLGDKKSSSGVGNEDSTDTACGYAVWAISSGRESCGLVRVACSEKAQTDIPRSAIQRVQSEDHALSALVKARCVLNNFEPALRMLVDDQGSPESIEPWTLTQVRTLEKALVKAYDPRRGLHCRARPGIKVDREDFIDLATVSKEVPGKTPAQVLSFYYRYLATAKPLTDVVHGPDAAEARRQEPISPISSGPEGDAIIPGYGRLTGGNAKTVNSKTLARQVSPGLCKASPASSSGNASESAPKPKHRVIRMSAPKPIESAVAITKPKDTTAVDSVPNYEGPTKRDPPQNNSDAVGSAGEAVSTSHSPAAFKHATNKATSGGHHRPANADRVAGRPANRQGDGGGDLHGTSAFFAQQRRYAVRQREVSRTLPPLPPDAEILEVDDSDDADGIDVTQSSALSASGGAFGDEEPTQPSGMVTASRRINSMGPVERACLAWQMRLQAEPIVASGSQPSGVLKMAPRSMTRNSKVIGGKINRGSVCKAYGYRSESSGFPSTQRDPMWEHPPRSRSIRHEEQVGRLHDRPNDDQAERGVTPSSEVSGPGYPDQRTVPVGSEPASRDDTFGSMAPCWRLLERAQAYMGKDQLEYMRGLVIAHVRKPMPRDQLLERAEGCLHEQDKILTAFVKMFDRIDQPPEVPLAKRALHPRQHSAPYSVLRSPDADPIHASPHARLSPQNQPPRAFKDQGGDINSLPPINNGGECSVSVSTPSQPYPGVRISVSGRVDVRRSIRPNGHDGAGRWRASGVGSTGRNDAVGVRTTLAPYPESRPGTSHGGGARVRTAWSQQLSGKWTTETGSLATAVAPAPAAPGNTSRRGSRGPAWGAGEGGTWS